MKRIVIIVIAVLGMLSVNAQVNKRTGFLLDTLTTTQLNALDARFKVRGSFFWDRVQGGPVTWNGTAWVLIGGTGGSSQTLSISANNTISISGGNSVAVNAPYRGVANGSFSNSRVQDISVERSTYLSMLTSTVAYNFSNEALAIGQPIYGTYIDCHRRNNFNF